MKSMCVIIPAFNEELAIEKVIASIKEEFPVATVLVIDDNSSDRTSFIANAAGAEVINLTNNLGIGGAVQTGLLYSRSKQFELTIQVDGDGQHIANEIQKLINPIIQGEADYVIGSRWLVDTNHKSKLARRLGIRILSSAVSMKINNHLTDVTSGFRAMNKEAIEILSVTYSKDFPEVGALINVFKSGLSIKEVSTYMNQRTTGKSSISGFKSIYYMVIEIVTIIFSKV